MSIPTIKHCTTGCSLLNDDYLTMYITIRACINRAVIVYVTEYWKTDHVRTFGQLRFIGPANSHTHTLPVHCCINGLS